ncbi:hypothetical protein BN2476_120010 [Paraburkholderia piptadeniae]|uniref:Uncharacterized protein n=1 Tax=Paraburkholderia piptadeniae TaxID=1701573 RepID=A0A1N7RR08_9BURK|nr:hypothetical protein BN2476_120010 [Paraburkholderia piptadeniae]
MDISRLQIHRMLIKPAEAGTSVAVRPSDRGRGHKQAQIGELASAAEAIRMVTVRLKSTIPNTVRRPTWKSNGLKISSLLRSTRAFPEPLNFVMSRSPGSAAESSHSSNGSALT